MKYILFFAVILNLGHQTEGKPAEPDSLNEWKTQVSYGLETDFNNKYLWRGISYNEGFVVQSNAWVSYHDFTFGVWNNITSYDRNNSIKRNEFDIYFSYHYNFLNFDIDNILTQYNFPYQPDSPPTAEYYLDICYPAGNFTISSNFTIDIMNYRGAYFVEHGIAYDYQLSDNLFLSSFLSLGWASSKFNETYVGISRPTLSIFSSNLTFGYQPTANLTIKPHIQLNRIIDKELYELLAEYSINYGIQFSMEF